MSPRAEASRAVGDRRSAGQPVWRLVAAVVATVAVACGGGGVSEEAVEDVRMPESPAEEATTVEAAPSPTSVPVEQASVEGTWELAFEVIETSGQEVETRKKGATWTRTYEIEPTCEDGPCDLLITRGSPSGTVSDERWRWHGGGGHYRNSIEEAFSDPACDDGMVEWSSSFTLRVMAAEAGVAERIQLDGTEVWTPVENAAEVCTASRISIRGIGTRGGAS